MVLISPETGSQQVDGTSTATHRRKPANPFAIPAMVKSATTIPTIGTTDRVFDLNPIPTLLLDSSLCVQRVSGSFLRDSKLSTEDCVGCNFLELLESKTLVSDTTAYRIKDTVNAAIKTHGVQTYKSDATDDIEDIPHLRVLPIIEDSELLYLVVEWQPVGSKKEITVFGNGLSINTAFRILVETVKDYAIFLLDTQGNVATWNAGAELNKLYKPHEIIGKHFSIFYGEEDLKACKPAKELEICMRDGRVEDEGWRYRKDGSRFWANVVITTVYSGNVHVGFSKVTRDLTERKATEDRLIDAYEESAKLKSEFLANMSHEIRTPMNGMLTACTLVLDTPLNEEQRELVGIIEDSGQILLQVINDILDYSKLSSGGFSLCTDNVHIANIVGSVVRSLQPTLRPGVQFELFISPEIPESTQGDPLRYRQIVQNLIGNAAKFTESGSIRINTYIEKEEEEAYTIRTEVTDTGIGVPELSRSALFTPFTQFDNSTTKLFRGTGLGLSISKSLVELMGGQIGFRPNPSELGSIFWFTVKFKKIKPLPEGSILNPQLIAANPENPENPAITNPRPSNASAKVFKTKTLLLAEDNEINRQIMLKMLRSLGFVRIDLATDGAQAIRLVMSNPQQYALILMDINMPLVDGVEATAEIRSSGNLLPIIALTANALKGDREKYLAMGMNDYIPKPVNRVYLTGILTKWLIQSELEDSRIK